MLGRLLGEHVLGQAERQAPEAQGVQHGLAGQGLTLGSDIDEDGVAVPLSSGEYGLLLAFVERPRRVLTRDQIMEAVRGRELEAFDRSIDVHMGRIRAAIEADPKMPKRILTVRGVGYVFAKQQD